MHFGKKKKKEESILKIKWLKIVELMDYQWVVRKLQILDD